ncbi:CHAP domain-containing protein [Actinokineospora sp. NBRC 105648]|uniref:C40 family peptidase n=1 Tax=Actinokineospora sp. NBRC 105648 TaxID=3032206 RepID=UPI0025575553|nr:CHAP domain-containing protein [Actinokineospora sp. NBRC 105648]
MRIARLFAEQMVEHRNRLAGKAEDARAAQHAFADAHKKVLEHRDAHEKATKATTAEWSGRSADGFARRAKKVDSALSTTAAAAAKGATIVKGTAETLDGGHTAVVKLIDEYTTAAAKVLDAGIAVGQRAALLRAVGQVVELVRDYTNETAKQVATVHTRLEDAAKELRALEKSVEHDGYADPRRQHAGTKPAESHKPSKPDMPKPGKHKEITQIAATQLGYREGANNANKYGPQAAWCSSFATWVWRRGGVNIPLYPFTGDVFTWGRGKGLAYTSLKAARPGDVLLFGTGPQNTRTSTHIGIVEKVDGGTVTLIEGNSGPHTDSVVRRTHPLSSSIFYGGVHPS